MMVLEGKGKGFEWSATFNDWFGSTRVSNATEHRLRSQSRSPHQPSELTATTGFGSTRVSKATEHRLRSRSHSPHQPSELTSAPMGPGKGSDPNPAPTYQPAYPTYEPLSPHLLNISGYRHLPPPSENLGGEAPRLNPSESLSGVAAQADTGKPLTLPRQSPRPKTRVINPTLPDWSSFLR